MDACLRRRMAVFRGTRLISDNRTAKTCLCLLVGSIIQQSSMPYHWDGFMSLILMTVALARSGVIGFRCGN